MSLPCFLCIVPGGGGGGSPRSPPPTTLWLSMEVRMFPFLGSLISAGSSLLGGLFSQNSNQQMMQQQMAFQQQMSNTAYQRASRDMTAAGLNPMMMFGGGSAASTPAGATGQVGQFGQAVGQSVSTALNAEIMQKTIGKLTEEIANVKASTAQKVAETATELERPSQVAAQTKTELERAPQVSAQTWNTIADTYIKRAAFEEADLKQLYAKYGREFFDTPSGKFLYQTALAAGKIDDFLKPAKTFLGGASSARSTFQQRWIGE